jgi:tetratricopeptide (TPR) repeat protein
MPFVKKTDSQPLPRAGKLFIGRTVELLFFEQNILRPEDPTHNIISISGQGGVGKSTLLSRFIDEAYSSTFKDNSLAAIVDERQTTPLSMMEKFAEQLHFSGEFEKALKRYKEMLLKRGAEREKLQESLRQKVPDFAGAAVEGIPFAGPMLREATKVTTAHLLNERQANWMHKDAQQLENPLADLTKAFVTELNHLANTKVTLSSHKTKRMRVILFFDTFEQFAAEAVPWLLDYFLEAEINKNVVLVIAGRDPIEHSTSHDTKRWLPHFDNETIYSISLNSFTEDETRTYLAQRDITDSDYIDTIWQLSHGLPLYLGLLTSNPMGKVDPTKDVVDNFLRRIPEHDQIKRQLALDAALFSRPFNQDDLEAFAYVPENERSILYRWLIGQTFVRSQDGRYSYHDLVKELFSRHLYHQSRKGYYATRRALAHRYRRLLEEIQREEGKEIYHSTEWFRLILAFVYQLLCLPDEASHIKAIEQVLYVLIHRHNTQVFFDQIREIARMFRELSETSINDTSHRTQQVIKHLCQWFEPSTRAKEYLETYTFLLHTVAHEPSFPPELLARLYSARGEASQGLKGHHQQAVDDFQRALALLDPTAHRDRGWVYLDLGEYQQAIREFNGALELDPHDAKAYEERGWAYFYFKDYQRAIDDFEHILELDPNDTQGHNGRGQIHMIFKEYKQALVHFERIVELLPTVYLGYGLRGRAYRELKEYQRAIDDFERALELTPNCFALYERGYFYLWLKDMKQAWADFTSWWELNPVAIVYGWMAEWVSMCQLGVSSNTPERLEELIAVATPPMRYYPRVFQGVVLLLRECFEEAIAELDQAISWEAELWDAYFWKGMACASLQRDEEAMAAIDKALEKGLPPALLAPLSWFKQERPEFYETYAAPLLARYE